MLGAGQIISGNPDLAIYETIDDYAVKERRAQITSFALALIAVFIGSLACVFLGVGTLPPTLTYGLGMVGTLVGYFFGLIGGSVLCGSLIYFIIASIRGWQKLSLLKEAHEVMTQSDSASLGSFLNQNAEETF